MDLNALKALYLDRIDQSQQREKSFSDMLRERRNFVQGNENRVGDMARGYIVNGSNGVPVNPVDQLDQFIGYHTDNANKTAQLTQEGFGYGQQTNEAIKALSDLILGEQANARANASFDLQKRASDREDYLSGFGQTDSNGQDASDPVTLAAKNILSGTQKLSDVPGQLKTRVASKLKEMGYDPGKQANTLVDNLEGLYFGKPSEGSLSIGRGLPATGGNINMWIQGMLNTPYAQRVKLYNDTKSGFAATLKTLTGDTGVLTDQDYARLAALIPSQDDTESQARSKLKQLRDQINAKFKPGENVKNQEEDPLKLF